jgi:hypothetical protein
MRPLLAGVWAALVSGLLITALLLGFAASRGVVDPGLHGMVSVVAAAFAIGSHVRRGGEGDFLAAVLLLAAVGLGMAAGVGGGLLHPPLAVVATAVSVGHLLRPVEAGRARVPETPG